MPRPSVWQGGPPQPGGTFSMDGIVLFTKSYFLPGSMAFLLRKSVV